MTREIKNILCSIDLSADNNAALRNGIVFAQSFQAKLSVCLCVSEHSSAMISTKTLELNEFIKNTIDYFVSGTGETPKIEWKSFIVENDNAALGIIEAVQCRKADLAIINSTPQPRPHKLLGSAAEDVCRSAPCPVLVVKPQTSRGEKIPIQRILAAHDFSDYSELALQYATRLAQKFKAELHLLHVINEEPEFDMSDLLANNIYHRTKERLQKALFNKNHKITKVIASVRWGKPYREILAYLKEQKIELVAMGAHGADFGLETLFGSNVERVLRQTPCAILVARPYKPEIKEFDEHSGRCGV